jgi:hypothetical protein
MKPVAFGMLLKSAQRGARSLDGEKPSRPAALCVIFTEDQVQTLTTGHGDSRIIAYAVLRNRPKGF